jgi:hypothetical protein
MKTQFKVFTVEGDEESWNDSEWGPESENEFFHLIQEEEFEGDEVTGYEGLVKGDDLEKEGDEQVEPFCWSETFFSFI